jgi:catechol 2,3-dioxygenase-like lactoylglutathione lyase family enzyme
MRILPLAAAALVLATPVAAQLAPESNDLGIRFAHVHLNVTDVAANEELWSNVFDGQIVVKGTLHTVRFPNMLVVFNQREPSGPSQGTVMDHFGFKVRDIQKILDEWRARGLEVQSEFNGAEGFRNAYLLAPDGVRLELQEDPELPVKAAGEPARGADGLLRREFRCVDVAPRNDPDIIQRPRHEPQLPGMP